MSDEEQGVEVVGVVATILMVVIGLVIGISPMLTQVALLAL